MNVRCTLAFLLLLAPSAYSQTGGYSPPIRIATPITGRCINMKTDEVTVTLRRILTQKNGNFLFHDKTAGITVMSTLNATSDETAKTPSVNQVDIQKEKTGQVSLALEYAIADLLLLNQDPKHVTKNIQLDLFMAKTVATGGFGTVIDIASQVFSKMPIPANPYTTTAGKFLQFANQTIQAQTGPKTAMQFASLTLPFNDRDEDAAGCVRDGFQPTGAVAVFRDTGAANTPLLPTKDLNAKYCFRYTSQYTYELQFVSQPAGGCANIPENAWHEVPNDYVMCILNAQKAPLTANKTLSGMSADEKQQWNRQRQIDIDQSRALCKSMRLPARSCGVK
jgi:hypothetical protein